ncbi:MAG: hypothetical protein P8171_01510 [Candidatus Thiodiazotropha sp.]|jgi:hypothetical protein
MESNRPLRLLMALLLTLLVWGCDSRPGSDRVKVSEQPAQGLIDTSFDQGYLQQLVEETRAGAEARVQEAYTRNNIPPEQRISHAQAEGRFEKYASHRLAVVELGYTANPMRVLRIVGIEQDRLISLSCISPHGEALDLFNKESDCGRGVASYFAEGAH